MNGIDHYLLETNVETKSKIKERCLNSLCDISMVCQWSFPQSEVTLLSIYQETLVFPCSLAIANDKEIQITNNLKTISQKYEFEFTGHLGNIVGLSFLSANKLFCSFKGHYCMIDAFQSYRSTTIKNALFKNRIFSQTTHLADINCVALGTENGCKMFDTRTSSSLHSLSNAPEITQIEWDPLNLNEITGYSHADKSLYCWDKRINKSHIYKIYSPPLAQIKRIHGNCLFTLSRSGCISLLQPYANHTFWSSELDFECFPGYQCSLVQSEFTDSVCVLPVNDCFYAYSLEDGQFKWIRDCESGRQADGCVWDDAWMQMYISDYADSCVWMYDFSLSPLL